MANRKALLGIVARCVHEPPTRAYRSTTATDLPCLTACMAAPSPPGPVPMTTTSNFCSSIIQTVLILPRQPHVFDLAFDHPFQPGFLFFRDFDLGFGGTVERRHDSKNAVVERDLCICQTNPIFAGRQLGNVAFPRNRHEIR